jgi:hypothetical protein
MRNANKTETEHGNVELFPGRYQVEAHRRLDLADGEGGGGGDMRVMHCISKLTHGWVLRSEHEFVTSS